jgi:hypothetical protein
VERSVLAGLSGPRRLVVGVRGTASLAAARLTDRMRARLATADGDGEVESRLRAARERLSRRG